jgi:hypothetical protein
VDIDASETARRLKKKNGGSINDGVSASRSIQDAEADNKTADAPGRHRQQMVVIDRHSSTE